MGQLVLHDLQIDASRAHRHAHEVRQNIDRKLFPIVQVSLLTTLDRVTIRLNPKLWMLQHDGTSMIGTVVNYRFLSGMSIAFSIGSIG